MIRRGSSLARSLGLALGLSLSGACGPGASGPGTSQTADETTADTAASRDLDRDLRTEHQEQFKALMQPAVAFLVAVDPIGAASVGKGELRPRPSTADERSAVASKLDRAERAAADLEPDQLAADAAIGLQGLRFAIARERDAIERHPPGRTDANQLPAGLLDLLREIEFRRVVGVECGSCGRALARAAAVLPETSRNLTAVSLAGTVGGQMTLASLERSARALALDPDLERSATELARAALAERETLATRLSGLAEQPDLRWDEPAPLPGDTVVHRLPDALGPAALRRRLALEEGIDTEPRILLRGVESNLEHYTAMKRKVPPQTPPGPAAALTAARCQARWNELRRRVDDLGVLPRPAKLDCEKLAQLRPEPIDEPDLDLLLLDLGVIEPARRALREAQTPAIALVAGRLGPPAQLHLRRVSYTSALRLRPATLRALERGARDLCQAGVALCLHANLAEDSELDAWLAKHCPNQDAQVLRRRALEDPRGSLRGLLLATLDTQAADMVRLDRYWWAPAGQQRLLADPSHANARPDGMATTTGVAGP